VPLEALSTQEKAERAYELAISALLGEGLYNFGKLVSTVCIVSECEQTLNFIK
jgi:hypothetical protein